MIQIQNHPLLDVACLESVFPEPLGEQTTPEPIISLLDLEATSPFARNDGVRQDVRDLLRHGGYRPSGRGKPSSEYLQKAVGDGRLGSINPAVDICNIVSLHSGLPISVIDRDVAREPFSIAIAGAGDEYVFNASGQTIGLNGLLCLFDDAGPCGNAVKDSQRTKTSDTTTRTMSVIWGTTALPGLAAQAADWYRELLEAAGAEVKTVG